jgi:hypothetical protein
VRPGQVVPRGFGAKRNTAASYFKLAAALIHAGN